MPRFAATLADLGLVTVSSLVSIGGGWVLVNKYLGGMQGAAPPTPATGLFWQWAEYFRTGEIFVGVGVIFVMYQIIFRFLAGKTLGQMLLRGESMPGTASHESLSGKLE